MGSLTIDVSETARAKLQEIEHDAPWVASVMARMKSLVALQSNWNSFGSKPITQVAVSTVFDVLKIMRPCTIVPSIVPTAPGGLQIEWHDRGLDLEIAISATGHCSASMVDLNSGEECEGDLVSVRPQLSTYIDRLS